MTSDMGDHSGGLNENCAPLAHVLEYLVPAGGTIQGVMELLEHGVLRKEAHHWRWALTVYSLAPLPVHSLCFLFVIGM